MLTVTIKTIENTARTLEAIEVTGYCDAHGQPEEVVITKTDGTLETHTGHCYIYVMNEKGSTVAKYDFVAPRVPVNGQIPAAA